MVAGLTSFVAFLLGISVFHCIIPFVLKAVVSLFHCSVWGCFSMKVNPILVTHFGLKQ